MIALAFLLLQATPDTPASFSILAAPCPQPAGDEVVVCGRSPERLPLPVEPTPPTGPMPSNPEMIPLNALSTPCGGISGCGVGFNIFGPAVAAVRLVQKAIDPDGCCEDDQATNPLRLVSDAIGGAKRIGAKKPDKTGRVAIDLDAPPPDLAGRVR